MKEKELIKSQWEFVRMPEKKIIVWLDSISNIEAVRLYCVLVNCMYIVITKGCRTTTIYAIIQRPNPLHQVPSWAAATDPPPYRGRHQPLPQHLVVGEGQGKGHHRPVHLHLPRHLMAGEGRRHRPVRGPYRQQCPYTTIMRGQPTNTCRHLHLER